MTVLAKKRKKRPLFLIYLLYFLAILILFLFCVLFFIPNGFTRSANVIKPIPAYFKERIDKKSYIDSKVKELETILNKANINHEKITSKEDYLSVVFSDDGEVLLSIQKPLEEQVSSLQFIINRFTIEGKRFSRIDLRFNKPVIIFR